ncbi:MAG: response regulator [Oligoflexia bacterium]|nr:response regulator [Oligoflexia bacterium]
MLKILLVEDEPDIAELCSTEIKENILNTEVIIATNALEGYRKARMEAYDLIWTDYRMPKILGTDFALALRETSHNHNVPIVIFSGYVEEAKINCQIKDNIHYISKLSGVAAAVTILKGILEQRTKHLLDSKSKGQSNGKDKDDKQQISLESPLVKNFICSTVHIMQLMCNLTEIKQTNIKITTGHEDFSADVICVVNMSTNDISGYFLLAFTKKVFLKVAEHFLGDKHTEITKANSLAAVELSKIIFGHTRFQLNDQEKINLQREDPQLIVGKRISITGHRNNMAIISFNTDIGDFIIGINPIDNLIKE